MDSCQVAICEHCAKPFDFPVEIEVCAQCGEDEAREVNVGDESLTVCWACKSIEGGYKTVFSCPNCGKDFEDEVLCSPCGLCGNELREHSPGWMKCSHCGTMHYKTQVNAWGSLRFKTLSTYWPQF